ncbi:cyanoexosortase A [Synechocystis salina LEGE 06155]|nr:cyanoexosortase A [Synechocystis salina LEGE 06155]
MEKWLKYGALTLCSLLTILQWQAVAQRDDPALLATNFLIFVAIGSLLWEKRRSLPVQSGWAGSLLGFVLVLLVLLRSLARSGYQPQISLFIAGIGLCLLVAGGQGLKHYWRELAIASLLMVDPILVSLLQALNLPLMTAHFSTVVLSTLGFNARQQGLFILLPAGRVEVYGVCSGIDSIVQMVNLAVILALILPVKPWAKYLSFILAPAIGFGVNALRVALLTFLISESNMTAFHYWHDNPNASGVFFLIAAALLLVFHYGCLRYGQGSELVGQSDTLPR